MLILIVIFSSSVSAVLVPLRMQLVIVSVERISLVLKVLRESIINEFVPNHDRFLVSPLNYIM